MLFYMLVYYNAQAVLNLKPLFIFFFTVSVFCLYVVGAIEGAITPLKTTPIMMAVNQLGDYIIRCVSDHD